MNPHALRPSAHDYRSGGAGGGGALERGLNVSAGQARSEKGGDEGVACAGGVDRLDPSEPSTRQRRVAFRGLGAGCATLDDDQRVAGGQSRALGFGIVGACENRGFLFIGEQDCRASRPCEEILGARPRAGIPPTLDRR